MVVSVNSESLMLKFLRNFFETVHLRKRDKSKGADMQIKRNRFLFKSIWLAMIIPFILASVGCVFGRTEAPYFS